MSFIRRFLFALLALSLCYCLLGQDHAPRSQLSMQEAKSYSKVELALQSVQSEIDGLQNLARISLMDSERLTSELEESEARSSSFESQLESIGVSFSELSIAYSQEKMKNQELITRLVVALSVAGLLAISYIVDLVMWVKKKKFLWWG